MNLYQRVTKVTTVEVMVTRQDLVEPRLRTVLAHGCFDGLHPGHLRHLQHAKSHGELLVVSVTTDAWVNKGSGRPYIPDYLRAELVAGLECVDYVLLADGPSAARVIRGLKPDIFAKGAEYRALKDPRTLEEIDALVSVNGRMVFTPDEARFSSTVLFAPATS